jgi:hypothetical protein
MDHTSKALLMIIAAGLWINIAVPFFRPIAANAQYDQELNKIVLHISSLAKRHLHQSKDLLISQSSTGTIGSWPREGESRSINASWGNRRSARQKSTLVEPSPKRMRPQGLKPGLAHKRSLALRDDPGPKCAVAETSIQSSG